LFNFYYLTVKQKTMKSHLLILNLIALLFVSVSFIGCTEDIDGETIIAQSEVLVPEDQPQTYEMKKGDLSIAEIAIANGNFTELVAALQYVDQQLNAGLVDLLLNGKDQYTVFAPTDMAFNDLYAATGVIGITDLPAQLVLDVLTYHVTEGRRKSNSVVPKNKPRNIETLLTGASFDVDNTAMITAVGNTANIVAADISASNGIIHVIDAVILPQ